MRTPPQTNPWNELLEDTRDALAHLRAEQLEDLAARAQCLLDASLGQDPARQRILCPQQTEIDQLAGNQYLLGSLLRATDANLQVIEQGYGRENSPWAR